MPEDDPQGRSGRGHPPKEPNLWALAGSGLELAAAVGVFTVLGWWLDGVFSTKPWMMISGASLGFGGGMYNLWKQTKRYL